MTAWNQTISNTVSVYGIEPPNLWGVIVWGVDNWGFGSTPLIVKPISVYAESEAPTNSSPLTNPKILYGESESPTYGHTRESLGDGGGFLYVFNLPTSNAENRGTTSFSCGAAASDTWTSGTVGTTVWS